MARKVLGQGLRALIPEGSELAEEAGSKGIVNLHLDEISPNPFQPRQRFAAKAIKELADSIREQGLLQPVLVRKMGSEYEIVVGERRVRAARLAGLKTIPALVKDNIQDDELLTIAIVENIQREDLDSIEEARAFKELMAKANLTQEKLAKRIGKSREAIANAVRLLKLPKEIQQLIAEGRLSAGHARALLAIESPTKQKALAYAAVEQGLSVRQLETLSSRSRSRKRAPHVMDPDIEALQLKLEEAVAARVKLKCRGEKGRVEIYFRSLEELDRIISILRR